MGEGKTAARDRMIIDALLAGATVKDVGATLSIGEARVRQIWNRYCRKERSAGRPGPVAPGLKRYVAARGVAQI
ncbi:MAG: hypothetical protein QOH47_2435 [Sphingomonadales bacterium]|jgi:hypothetical protein|nr:hypothetical protein [Sphingomonadales bacterium]